MGLAPGQRALAVNGLVYGPLDEDGESIEVEDFALVEKLLEKRGARAVAQRVDEWRGARGPRSSTMTLRAWAALAKHATKRKRQLVELDHATESVIHLVSQDDTTPALKLVAIVDPLSIQAQKLAPILQTLLRVVNADLDLGNKHFNFD
jgi:UDP-glucose:glycoprotein glucosyltransferase